MKETYDSDSHDEINKGHHLSNHSTESFWNLAKDDYLWNLSWYPSLRQILPFLLFYTQCALCLKFIIVLVNFTVYLSPATSLVAQTVKRLPTMRESRVQSLGREDLPEKEMATHSSILPGRSHGQRSLVGYSPWGRKESDTTEQLHFHLTRWHNGKESACRCRSLRFNPCFGKIPWRRKREPTPVFLPGKSQGQGSLAGYHVVTRGWMQLGNWALRDCKLPEEDRSLFYLSLDPKYLVSNEWMNYLCIFYSTIYYLCFFCFTVKYMVFIIAVLLIKNSEIQDII